jgi:uroporphyrinogen decarboxylase
MTAERYEHDAIFIHPNPDSVEETLRLVDLIREKTGDRYFILRHGDATFSIPDGVEMFSFANRIADDRPGLKAEAAARVDQALREAEIYQKHGGLDGFALCSDYCFNSGPFLSPRMFGEFITPYLARLTQAYREMGFYTIKHTDGNILPILDQLAQTHPHALHSLDPMAGVDIAEVKRRYGEELCLIGNVNCAKLDTGSEAEVVESARYCLRHGMPGYGYIFSTSNCIYTGMRLSRYDLMLDVWRQEGNYP